MNEVIWKRVKPLVDDTSIEQFEKNYNIVFPKELNELIVNNNGGRPSLNVIKAEDNTELEIKCLLSFNNGDIENIYVVIDYFIENFNKKIIPIASESSGDYFCIDLDSNAIVYWKHENNELNFVAKNIKEFVNKLYTI